MGDSISPMIAAYFLKAKGQSVGNSLVEAEMINEAKAILKEAESGSTAIEHCTRPRRSTSPSFTRNGCVMGKDLPLIEK